jgi:hypothetical protein
MPFGARSISQIGILSTYKNDFLRVIQEFEKLGERVGARQGHP